MKKTIAFITLGDISAIATMKRALGMANPLNELGWEVSIIAMDCEENRKRISMECNSNIRIHYYKDGGVKHEIEQKTKFVKEVAPAYVYFCSLSPRNFVRKSKLGYKPVMITEHSELLSSIQGMGIARKLKSLLMEWGSVIYSDRLIGASVFLVKTYRKYSRSLFKPRMPILYSPYAYNNDVIDAPRIVIEKLKVKYQGRKLFVYMGTMTRNYGLFTMVEAAEKLRMIQPSAKLLLMGKGRHWEEAKKYIEEHDLQDTIELLGYVAEEELSSYFEIADAFISPVNNTIQDIARCPSKIYMYLPFSKPVLTCRIGEPAEIFGDNGYYFDNSNAASLSELMRQICTGETHPVRVNVEEHSWNKRSADFDKWIAGSN